MSHPLPFPVPSSPLPFRNLAHRSAAGLCAAVALAVLSFAASSEAGETFSASVSKDSIQLRVPPEVTGSIEVHALAAWETEATPSNLVFSGSPTGGTIEIARTPGGPDPLLRAFVVNGGGSALAEPFFVTGFDDLPRISKPLAWPESIKGVSNPEGGAQDLLDLGVAHVHINLVINHLLLPEAHPDPAPEFIREVDGQTLRFNPSTVAEWDRKISELSDAGINVIAVILNQLPGKGQNRDLLHPRTDVEGAPFKLGAFNTTNPRGVASFVGILSYLAERYSDPASERGVIGGYIVGNEVDSHWTWHNMGLAGADEVIAQYATELRLAWIAIRSRASEPPVYVSLTHSWARMNSLLPEKNLAGKVLLEGLTRASRAGGDFAWAVAHHPYPQNLFEPRFWNDQMALYGYDTPMITFKNIELLPEWLRREENLVNGEARRVILSEQGFHTPDGDDGEEVQAAAYALAFHRIERTPGIDAFILHRHVDVRGEGGLLLGVRGLKPLDGSAPYGPKKKSWETFRVSGTPAFESEAAFALAHAGYSSWSEADPLPGPFPERSPGMAAFERASKPLLDLLAAAGEARFENTLAAKQDLVGLPDGGLSPSLLLHPLGPAKPAATATWQLELPADQPAKLVFRTYLTKQSGGRGGDGVVFRVRVGGELGFERTVDDHAMRDGEVDLQPWAGQTVALTLEVAPRKTNNYDGAQWLAPAVVFAGEAR